MLYVSNYPTNTSGGTVTNIATGTGLTGGPITSTGTIALNYKLSPLDTLGTPGQAIRVNTGGTALEYFTVGASGQVNTVVAGTGISVNSTDPVNPIVINTAPDKVVAITAGTNITSVTGTYPNFTVNAATQSYTLPIASTTVLGGVKQGTNISIDANGVISSTASGTGDVVGPASAVDSNFASYNTTTGKLIKDSGSKASDFQPALGFTAENVTNKITSISGASTDTQYPSAKLVYDQLATKGSGTVTAIGVTTANGVSGSSSGGATPNLTIALGAITPSSVNGNTITTGTGTLTMAAGKTLTNNGNTTLGLGGIVLDNAGGITATASKVLTIADTSSISGTNTGDNATNSQYSGLATSKLDAQFAVDINRQGFLNTTQTSISFTGTTFTLTDAGSGWSYYRTGVKYTISGNKTVALSAATAGVYYIYIDATDGTLTCSAVNTPWTLLDTKVPVATVTYNSTLTPTFWLADERHTALIDQRMEYYLHSTTATKLVSTPSLSGYTLNSDVNANKTFAISAGTLLDQDLKIDVASLTQPNGTATDYSVWYRTAASTWAWKSSNMPFVYNVGNTNDIIQYDNGGTMTDGTTGSARWLNSYLLISNKQGVARHIIVPGRGNFTTLAQAQAESVSGFTWAGFEVDEAVVAYRLTWALLTGTYTSQGKCRLAATPQLINISSTTNASSGAGTDHNTLSNLQGGVTNEYNHLTNAELAVVQATSGTNTGDNAVNSNYSGLVSNATHTGEVTGATTLTVDKTAITNKTLVTAATDDKILISDTSDTGNLKYVTAQSIADLSPAGTVTSVAALTLGTTGTDLSSTVATGTTTPVITLQVPTASASNRGALSAADWSTFNGKQAAGSYEVTTAKDATGGYAGLTLFKLNLKNAANTFTNFLTNATTAARTWTFPDKDGTVAMTSDLTAGTVTATGGALTANSVVLGAGTTDTKISTGITTDGTAQLNLGVNATTLGKLKLFGNTSGDATIQTQAVAGTGVVLTLPNVTGNITYTGGTLTSDSILLGNNTSAIRATAGLNTDGVSSLVLGINTTTIGKVKMFGNTSGDVTIQPTAAAGTATVQTLPSTTGTLVNRVTTANGVSASNSDGALTVSLGAITPTTVNGHTFTTGSSTFTGTAAQTYTFPATTSTLLSTTGTAAKATVLETTRAIYGNNFDGSAALTGVIASTYGGTGNGFTKFTGPTTAEKTFTLPDASSTIVVQGGALGTPSSGTLTSCTGLPIAGLTASTSTALGVGSIELGHATDTTIARVSAGVVSIEGSNILTAATGIPLAGGVAMTGEVNLGENAGFAYDSALSADGKYSGIVLDGTAGATLAFGDICCPTGTSNKWVLADANVITTASGDGRGILGVCVLAANDTQASKFLLQGMVRADTAFPALTINEQVFLSETAGDVTLTKPTTADSITRCVGMGTAGTGDNLYFNPSFDYITHA